MRGYDDMTVPVLKLLRAQAAQVFSCVCRPGDRMAAMVQRRRLRGKQPAPVDAAHAN